MFPQATPPQAKKSFAYSALRQLPATLLAAALLAGVGCATPPEDPGPELEALNHYSSSAVRFSYPGNWQLDEDVDWDEQTEVRTISINHKKTTNTFSKKNIFDGFFISISNWENVGKPILCKTKFLKILSQRGVYI